MSRIDQIIRVFFSNEYAGNIRKQFHIWLRDDSFRNKKDEAMLQLWDELSVDSDASTIESFRQVRQTLEWKKHRYSIAMRFVRVAAIVLVPLLSILASYIYMNQNIKNEDARLSFKEYFVPNGTSRQIELPDHSVVTVNSGSVIIVPEQFGEGSREVYLNGEAYFSVAKDEKRPFIVKTDGVDVEVLGTTFNVSSYPDNDNVTTTLEEGKVKLHFKKGKGEDMILNPNDQVVYNRESGLVIKKTVNPQYVSSWREGHLIFQRTSIYEIINMFEKKYDVTIYLNSDDYKNELLSVKFTHEETLEESFQILQEIIPGFKFKVDGKRVFIH